MCVTCDLCITHSSWRASNQFGQPMLAGNHLPKDCCSYNMFALLLEVMILKVMGNHAYSFNGINKLQLRGGPIGLVLAFSVKQAQRARRGTN